MDLPVSSFVFYFIFADSKSVDLVVARDSFLCIMKIVHIFHSLIVEVFFEKLLICTGLNIAENEAQWTIGFSDAFFDVECTGAS